MTYSTSHNQGFTKLPHHLLDDPAFDQSHPYFQRILIKIIRLACWAPTTFNDHGKILLLQPGELCITMRELAEKCGKPINKNWVERSIRYFCACQKLRQEIRHTKTVLKVCVDGIFVDSDFKIRQDFRQKLDTNIDIIDNCTVPVENVFVKKLIKFGLTLQEAQHILSVFSSSQISAVFAERKKLRNVPKITNPNRWLTAALNKKYPNSQSPPKYPLSQSIPPTLEAILNPKATLQTEEPTNTESTHDPL